MTKINYIAPKKVWKSLAKTAIILSTTLLVSCDANDIAAKRFIVSDTLEDAKIYNQDGMMSFMSNLYYVENINTDEAYICRKEFLKQEASFEPTLRLFGFFGMNGKMGFPMGQNGLMMTIDNDYYYVYVDVDTNTPIAVVEEDNNISVDNNYRVNHLLPIMAANLVDHMPSRYTKEQVEKNMMYYPNEFTTDELKDIMNINGMMNTKRK